MTRVRRGQDTLLTVSLFLLGMLARLPFRSRMLYHWDSVNFALGMEHFDVRLHQPQPPGHFFYVMVGRMIDYFVQDANSALVWVSVVSSSLMVVVVFYLCRAMFGQGPAIISALFSFSSPLIWFHSEIALSRIVAAFLSTAFAWACYELSQGKKQFLWLSAVLLGIIGGFRQQMLILLLPLWLFVSLRHRAWHRLIVAGAIVAWVTLLWLVPSVLLSGGWEGYWTANRAFAQGGLGQKSSLNSLSFLIINLGRLGVFTVYGLLLGLVPMLYVLVSRLRQFSSLFSDRRAWFVLIWAGPSFLLNMCWIEQPGHIFAFLPALILSTGPAVYCMGEHLGERLRGKEATNEAVGGVSLMVSGLAGLVLLANVGFFLLAPPFLFGVQRTVFSAPSWPNIQWRDRHLAERITFIKEQFDPQTTAVLASGLDFRHPDYYLRSYQYAFLSHKLTAEPIQLPSKIRHLVLFNDALAERNCSPERTKTLTMPSGALLYYLEPLDGERIEISLTEVKARWRLGY